jgi:cytidylate kinase
MIITISRQYAAGGSEVARQVAGALGWSLVDNQLIDEVAVRAGLSREEVAEREERAPGFIERLARALATSAPEFVAPESGTVPDLTEEHLLRITEKVVAEMTEAGNVVVVGRAAPAVLAQRADALHVRIVAPRADRVARAMARRGLDAKQAEKMLHDTDANRARYHQQYYGRDWDDPMNYHLVLNTARLGIEGAAGVIVGVVRRSEGDPAEAI